MLDHADQEAIRTKKPIQRFCSKKCPMAGNILAETKKERGCQVIEGYIWCRKNQVMKVEGVSCRELLK